MRSGCFFSPRVALYGPIVLSAALAGCASEGDALEKRFAKLQEELTRVQSQNDRMAERLDAVELRQATQERAGERERVANAGAPTTVSRPKLKVVRVESDGEALGEAAPDGTIADDSGPRVVIQGEGKSIETRSVPALAKTAPKSSDSKSDSKSENTKKPDSAKKSEAPK